MHYHSSHRSLHYVTSDTDLSSFPELISSRFTKISRLYEAAHLFDEPSLLFEMPLLRSLPRRLQANT